MKYIKLFEDIAAYHGSTLKFNEFDTEKLSQKSGQDTYGWGLYFTDSVDIAKSYIDNSDDKYIYRVKLHKGKSVNDYDYLIFEEKPTNSQLDKIKVQMEEQNIDLDLSEVKITWDLITLFVDYFYNKLKMEDQFRYGVNTAKKHTSKLFFRFGDGSRNKFIRCFVIKNTAICHIY